MRAFAGTVKALPQRGEFTRFQDPLTETVVTRLTSPASAALLPAPQNRFISYKDKFLVFSSNRGGKFAPYRMDLQTGMVRQITEANELDTASLTMDQSERVLLFLDGGILRACSLGIKHERALAEQVSQFSIADSFRVEAKTQRGGLSLLKAGVLQDISGKVLAGGNPVGGWLSPDGGSLLVERGAEAETSLFVVAVNGAEAGRERLLARGSVGFPFWALDSQHVLYLRGFEIRQASVRENQDELLASTSMFAAFAPNRDGSVFVGSSRSKAQPAVILLVRNGRSELMLCQHRGSQPAAVTPVFSPDSRRVYFQSDVSGNTAIFSVNTEALVDTT